MRFSYRDIAKWCSQVCWRCFAQYFAFDLSTKEVMEVVDGNAFVSINGAPEQEYKAGQSWEVEKGGYFIIRAEQPVHYVCHFE